MEEACKRGNVERVKSLMQEAGFEVNRCVNRVFHTPLHIACMYGAQDVVRELLAHPNIGVNCKTLEDETPLHFACQNRLANVVEELMKSPKLDINATTVATTSYQGYKSETALHFACQECSTPVVEQLMKSPSLDINAKTSENMTALHFACAGRSVSVVEKLLGRDDLVVTIDSDSAFGMLYRRPPNATAHKIAAILCLHKDLDPKEIFPTKEPLVSEIEAAMTELRKGQTKSANA
eukprot:CAMPEP_0117031624 /NCGR_PEP_ID=MMETSP0472-20121206/22709_1 /TAXON_ID=693140 ORGANISM="Tiarina fusus, Strain LIS" /NCGR_SAMPLE_ID=MMETSP0472 /ASSEMBLY_ACC=CAM_ASM_000603 /LENGTH=235 /DNA_ID=CAMNT_0004739989 /DNA_START=36 /DNA_END=743 /DNA_ORIENTATION=+